MQTFFTRHNTSVSVKFYAVWLTENNTSTNIQFLQICISFCFGCLMKESSRLRTMQSKRKCTQATRLLKVQEGWGGGGGGVMFE